MEIMLPSAAPLSRKAPGRACGFGGDGGGLGGGARIGEQPRMPARVQPDYVVAGPEAAAADEPDEPGHAFAGIDRIQDEGFQPGGATDGFERAPIWHAIGGA